MENIAEYKTYDNQSWLDISNILYGSSAYAFDLATLNKASITSEISAGTSIKYNADISQNKWVLLSMESYKSIPATAVSQWQIANSDKPEGIDYWAIQMDFIVS